MGSAAPCTIPVIVINLPDSTARLAAIGARLRAQDIPFSVLDAVDGRRFTDEEALRRCPGRARLTQRWPLSNREIACTASHLAALQSVADAGHAFACILEDDAAPDADFSAFLDRTWLESLPAFDLVKLSGDFAHRRDFLVRLVGHHASRKVCVPLHPTFGGRAYVVSRHGARRLLARSRVIEDSADVFLFRRPLATARIMDVRPFPVGTTSAPSTMAGDRFAQASAPAWRPVVCWLPHRLALVERKLRRYMAFVSSQGVGGLRHLERVSFVGSSTRAVPAHAGDRKTI